MAIKIENVCLSLEQIAHSEETVLCVGIREKKEWSQEQKKYTDNVIARIYEIVLPDNAFEKIDVEVVGASDSIITDEMLEKNGSVSVGFTNFKGYFKRVYGDNRNPYVFKATAEEIFLQ